MRDLLMVALGLRMKLDMISKLYEGYITCLRDVLLLSSHCQKSYMF